LANTLRPTKKSNFNWFSRILNFYTLPLVRFGTWTLFYLCFLGIVSAVAIIGCSVNNILILEIVMYIWVFGLLVDEYTQFSYDTSNYLPDFWNTVDIVIIISFAITCTIRMIAYYSKIETLCDVVDGLMILNVLITYFRLFDIFSVFSVFGPLLIIIRRILEGVLTIITFVILFVICFSIAFIVVTVPEYRYKSYPNEGTLGAVWWAWLFEFSEILGHEEFFKVYPLALVLLTVFIVVGPFFWIGVLIAMFNDSYTTKKAKSEKEWKFGRYFTLEEFRKSDMAVPPLNLIAYIFLFFRFLLRKIFFCKRVPDEASLSSRRSLSGNENDEDKMKKSLSKLEKRMNKAKNDFFEHEESLNALKVEARISKLYSRMEEKWKYLEVDRELEKVTVNEKLRLFGEKMGNIYDKLTTLEKNFSNFMERR